MSTPLLTVGIPIYNAQESLLDAVRSVFAQTFADWELILVDDGSTDNSLDIASSIDDPRVQMLKPDGENLKLPSRLNQIVRSARGKYIARMDADDLSHPERFSRQLAFLRSHPEVDVVGTYMCILDHEDKPASKVVVQESHDEIVRNKFSSISIAHATVIAKAEWFRCWPYDESSIRCEDYELWLRSSRESTFANIPEVLYLCNEFRSFVFSKYARSKKTAARVVWKYGRREIGTAKALWCVIGKYVDIGLLGAASILRLHDTVIRGRKTYVPLSPEEDAKLTKALDTVRKTKVPLRGSEA